jgi:hypothetical protein
MVVRLLSQGNFMLGMLTLVGAAAWVGREWAVERTNGMATALSMTNTVSRNGSFVLIKFLMNVPLTD